MVNLNDQTTYYILGVNKIGVNKIIYRMTYMERYEIKVREVEDLIRIVIRESGEVETSGSVTRVLCDPEKKPGSFQFFTLTPMINIASKPDNQIAHHIFPLQKYNKYGEPCTRVVNAIREMDTRNRHIFVAYGGEASISLETREAANEYLKSYRDEKIEAHERKNEAKRLQTTVRNERKTSLECMKISSLRAHMKYLKSQGKVVRGFSGLKKEQLIAKLVDMGAAFTNTENGLTFKRGEWENRES